MQPNSVWFEIRGFSPLQPNLSQGFQWRYPSSALNLLHVPQCTPTNFPLNRPITCVCVGGVNMCMSTCVCECMDVYTEATGQCHVSECTRISGSCPFLCSVIPRLSVLPHSYPPSLLSLFLFLFDSFNSCTGFRQTASCFFFFFRTNSCYGLKKKKPSQIGLGIHSYFPSLCLSKLREWHTGRE